MTKLLLNRLAFRSFFILICAVVLTACSATGPLFKEAGVIPPGKGRIYIYRPAVHAMSVVRALISMDNRVIAELDNNGYTVIDLAPGVHVLTHTWGKKIYTTDAIVEKPVSTPVSLRAGETRYVLLTSQAHAGLTGKFVYPGAEMRTDYRWGINEVPAVIGREQIVTTQFQQLTPDGEALSKAPLSADAIVAADGSEYAARLGGKIRSNIIYDVPPDVVGNPKAMYFIKLAPNGAVSTVEKLKSSGYAGYDAALVNAIYKSAPFPKRNDGVMPLSFEITFFMKDF